MISRSASFFHFSIIFASQKIERHGTRTHSLGLIIEIGGPRATIAPITLNNFGKGA